MKDNFDYLGELIRMCSVNPECNQCPLGLSDGCCTAKPYSIVRHKSLDTVRELIKEWSEKHPVKTRATEFKKMHPNCKVDADGYPTLCPSHLNRLFHEICFDHPVNRDECDECRQKYWSEEIKCSE